MIYDIMNENRMKLNEMDLMNPIIDIHNILYSSFTIRFLCNTPCLILLFLLNVLCSRDKNHLTLLHHFIILTIH